MSVIHGTNSFPVNLFDGIYLHLYDADLLKVGGIVTIPGRIRHFDFGPDPDWIAEKLFHLTSPLRGEDLYCQAGKNCFFPLFFHSRQYNPP